MRPEPRRWTEQPQPQELGHSGGESSSLRAREMRGLSGGGSDSSSFMPQATGTAKKKRSQRHASR